MRAPLGVTANVALLLLAPVLLAAGCGGDAPPPRSAHQEPASSPATQDDTEAAPPDQPEPDLDALLLEAEKALTAKDYANADRLAHEVVAHDPKGYPYAFVVLGDVQLAQHKDTQALALYDQAIAIDPTDGWSTVRAAEALEHLHRKPEALERLRRFVVAHPTTVDQDTYDALGWAELDGGDASKAEAAFRGALKAAGSKGDEDAYYGLALVAASRGDAKLTAENLLACFAINPARRIEANKDEGFAAVRKKRMVAALFTKKKLAEAASSPKAPARPTPHR